MVEIISSESCLKWMLKVLGNKNSLISYRKTLDGDGYEFATKLAHEAKVGVVPGSAFGEAGKNHFRLSYAASTEKLTEALNRITAFVEANNYLSFVWGLMGIIVLRELYFSFKDEKTS